MNEEKLKKMFHRIELDKTNDSCGFEFADGFGCTFDNIATCYDDRLKLYELVKQLQQENQSLKDGIEKVNVLIDTILTFNLFGEECPLNFGFEKDSLQEKAQNIFYEDDGEYCENNCDGCYKKCWLKFFERIQILKGDK